MYIGFLFNKMGIIQHLSVNFIKTQLTDSNNNKKTQNYSILHTVVYISVAV